MYEPVLIGSVRIRALFDPAKHQLYVDDPTCIQAGALVTVRGQVRRVTNSAYWNGAGTVVDLEPGPVYFPDAAVLNRVTFGTRDPETGIIPEILTPIWTGQCEVEAESSADAAQLEILDRRRELVMYTVKVPLEVSDIRQDDRIKITASRDPRLVDRILHVIRVLASSHAQERIVLTAERQV